MKRLPLYPNFQLCAPVTYESDPFQLCTPAQLFIQFAERYVRPGMPPLAAHPAAHCSVTRASARVGLPGMSNGPQRASMSPKPKSTRIRFVIGEVHVICCE